MPVGLNILAERPPWSPNVALAIVEQRADGKVAIADTMTMRVVDEGTAITPFVTITESAAQQLMDGLWRCGLRPSEGAGSAGSLAATERHLADMRTIGFAAMRKAGIEL